MANTTRFKQNQELPILLDKETVELIINQINELKVYLTFDFEEIEQCTEDRLSIAKDIIDCDNIIITLKQKLN